MSENISIDEAVNLPLVDGLAYSSPCALMSELDFMDLPVIVRVGRSRFKVTRENIGSVGLGVLLATDEGWNE